MEVNMDIESIRKEALETLEKIRQECEILIERTQVYRDDILNVKTEEDAKQFDETHDIEEGLEIIRLFW